VGNRYLYKGALSRELHMSNGPTFGPHFIFHVVLFPYYEYKEKAGFYIYQEKDRTG
jgi:hypothetical protein